MSVSAAVRLMFGAYMVTAKGDYPLDMADNSVDDTYDGCADKMLEKVKKEFLENEKNTNKNFSDAWNEAEMYYKGEKIASSTLERDELAAIYVYTQAPTNIYYELNKAVQKQGKEYKTGFNYHSLHYFLTRAIQKLAPKKSFTIMCCLKEKIKCHTSYRRTNVSFEQDVLNKSIRFGRFTSSSLHPLKSKEGINLGDTYGEKSCFVIETCYGADISPYSWVKIDSGKDTEAEILIPPYEEFKVTKIETREKDKELPCEVVYTVKSTREPVSRHNCAFFEPSRSHG
ncbi:T-cell ecto-ADP-ribosyltransferase 1-like [Oryzias melastigma]|uniref:T-cell ecto-ADP-ribosyltransferase 1-like n=1 Tax=Oryzias melastigma TaxID=30732 RepID=UPI000CF8027A|nr:T-cell ecto-ADP-ribosyltransferase 1-like [Oryzias melastigma]